MAFIVKPISRSRAKDICTSHPHAHTLPNSSKYYMELTIDGDLAGLAVWGYGVTPRFTPGHLFGEAGKYTEYLELCRFFVFDWCPKNSASKFLSTTHRIIRKYLPKIKWLYTYAAGFQGLIGHIYKASGYDYIGPTKCTAFLWIPNLGLIHRISLHNRYGKGSTEAKHWQKLFPGSKQWCGLNFRYIYWLCSDQEKEILLKKATFKILTYPTEKDLTIWTKDHQGKLEVISPELAKTIPIIKLSTKRAGSIDNDATVDQAEEGGEIPTPALHPTNSGNQNNTI